MGLQWHQLNHKLNHTQTICTLLQTDNHINTSSLNFYRLDAKYRVGQKNRTVFRLDNYVTVSPRKACSMSKFSKFY